MNKLEAIRTQRAETEVEFQTAFKALLETTRTDSEAQTTVAALHREVCALYNAELSLITSGKLEPSSSFNLHPSPFDCADSPTQPVPALPRQDAARLPLLPRLLARVTRRLPNRPLDDSSPGTP